MTMDKYKYTFSSTDGSTFSYTTGDVSTMSDLEYIEYCLSYKATLISMEPILTIEKKAAKLIWETSRKDEGTISASGANIIAAALAKAGLLTDTVTE